MRSFRLRGAGSGEGHGGEVFSCVYTADSAFVLSAGWDGNLRLWAAAHGQLVASLQASNKPLSCCTLSPDGTTWLSGSMEGSLSGWDAITHQLKWNFLGHIRPISAIQYSPDGQALATSSWDRKIVVRKVGKEREGQALSGHSDIVAGCRWSADGKQLLSWSHDGTMRLWEAETGRLIAQLSGHEDRVTAASFALDGQGVLSGSRDGSVKWWDLQRKTETRSVQLNGEIRGCWCLLDGESAVAVSSEGRLVLWSLPDFEVRAELTSDIKVMCGDLSPSGSDLVLGSEDGLIHFIAIDGLEDAPMVVAPSQMMKPIAGMFGRFLGRPKMQPAYQFTCPACRHRAEISSLPRQAIPCGVCQRLLRVRSESLQLQPQ